MISGEIAALLTACCWSVNALFFSFAGHRVGSYTVNHIRLWFALLVTLIFLAGNGNLSFNYSPTGVILMAISGLIGYALGDALLFEALVLLRVRDAMLLMLLSPIFSLLFGIFWFKEKIKLLEAIGIFLTLAGIGLVILFNSSERGSRMSLKGVGFAAGGALAQSLGLVFSKMGMSYGIFPLAANGIRLTSALLVMVFFTLIRGDFLGHWKKIRLDPLAGGQILAGALLGPFLGVYLALLAVSTGRLGVSSILMSLSPVLLLPISCFLLKEHLSFRVIYGTLLAFGGVALIFT